MIVVVQRVDEASVRVESPPYEARIGRGLCVLLAVERGDGEAQAQWIAGKIARLRVFPDEQEKMNRSVRDIAGAVLLVSQFTLAGNCAKGNRPSFGSAAEPRIGQALYESVAQQLRAKYDLAVQTGVFGAKMLLSVVNNGPVTLIVRQDQTRSGAL